MKKSFLVIFTLFLVCCSKRNDNSIGERTSENGFIIYENVLDSIKLSWNNILLIDSIETSIKELKIIKDRDLKTKKVFFGILGSTLNDSAKIVSDIFIKDDKLYFSKEKIFKVVICYGSKNCNPKKFDDKWICDDGSKNETCSINCQRKVVSTIIE